MTRGNQRDKDRQRALARKDKMSKGGTSQIEANQKALGIICTVSDFSNVFFRSTFAAFLIRFVDSSLW